MGTRARLGSLSPTELEARLSTPGLLGHVYRETARLAEANRAEIDARYPKIMRRVSGYNLDEFLDPDPFNLARIVVGSEGTLCTITEAKVKLEPLPNATGVAALHFDDIFQGVRRHISHNRTLSRRRRVHRRHDYPPDAGVPRPEALHRLHGGRPRGPGPSRVFRRLGARRFAPSSTPSRLAWSASGSAMPASTCWEKEAQAKAWAVRKAGLGLLMGVRGDAKPIPFVEDAAVDPTRLGEFGRRFDEIVQAHDTTASYYGHASVGCLHIRPLVNLKNDAGINRMESIAESVADLVLEFGGSLSGETRATASSGASGRRRCSAAGSTTPLSNSKDAFDPKRIMNPGKIVECPPMSENLRYGTDYRAQSLNTRMDFSSFEGYAGAVEMCNGMGECRKSAGVMCPSFQATREEEHSTRGRANLLRAALSGALSPRDHDQRTTP